MTDESDNILDPKTNRTPAELGREVFRLVNKHGAIRITPGDNEYDVRIAVDEEE